MRVTAVRVGCVPVSVHEALRSFVSSERGGESSGFVSCCWYVRHSAFELTRRVDRSGEGRPGSLGLGPAVYLGP